MSRRLITCFAFCLCVGLAAHADVPAGLDKTGPVELTSAGPIAFGPSGVLFVSDPMGAKIVAIDAGKTSGSTPKADFSIDGVDEKIAAAMKTTPDKVAIVDIAVQPGTTTTFVVATEGTEPKAKPTLLKIGPDGAVSAVSFDKVAHAELAIADAPAPDAVGRGGPLRRETVTDLAFLDGRLYIAGLSSAAEASKLRAVHFPFAGKDTSTSVEIYHGAHGKLETNAPIRTFVPFNVGGEPTLLAAYTCTPLVSFPLKGIDAGEKLRGTTVAELGNRNKPLDVVAYERDGATWLLMANSARGVMKIDTRTIAQQKGIDTPVADKAGLAYETIKELDGAQQLDKLDANRAVALIKTDKGMALKSIALP